MSKTTQLMTLSVAGSGSLEAYTHAVSTIPMLSADEERQLAERLQQWGEDYHYPPLSDYATQLHQQLQDFDSDNLLKTLQYFPEIIQQLKEIMNYEL